MIKTMNKYNIDENIDKSAKELNSFDDYIPNSATNEYNSYLNDFEDEINELIEKNKDNLNEEKLELIEYYKDKYSKKLAFAINKSNSIEARMPSYMITGGGNFNCRKKEKQNQARNKFYNDYGDLFNENNYYMRKIRNIITNRTIYSDDELAIEKLENKIADLEELQKTMKEINAYYRKNKKLEGCEYITSKKQEYELLENANSYHHQPCPSYELTNNNQNIHRLKERVENLKKLKERANQNNENKYIKIDGLQVVEDSTDMRIKLIFDEIPNNQTRDLLKHKGFRWSPTNKAWQRQLTNNGIYETKLLLEKLKEKTNYDKNI